MGRRVFPGWKCWIAPTPRSAAAFPLKGRRRYFYRRKSKRLSGLEGSQYHISVNDRSLAQRGVGGRALDRVMRAKEVLKPSVSKGVFWYFLSLLTKSARRRLNKPSAQQDVASAVPYKGPLVSYALRAACIRPAKNPSPAARIFGVSWKRGLSPQVTGGLFPVRNTVGGISLDIPPSASQTPPFRQRG